MNDYHEIMLHWRGRTENADWESRVLMSRLPLRRVRRRRCAEFSMISCTARNSDASGPASGACMPSNA